VYSDLETTEETISDICLYGKTITFFSLAELLTILSFGGVVNELFEKLLTNSFFNLRLIVLKVNLRG